MAESIKFLGLIALLLLGAGGWGTTTVTVLRRAGWRSVHEEIGPPLQIVLGVALFLAVGGCLVALNVAWMSVLLLWHLIGVVLLLLRLANLARESPGVRWPSARSVAIGVASAAAGILVVLVSLGTAIGTQLVNPYDDDAAYIYLAKRLLTTGGLIDPFNLRRLTGYGGSTLYQSMFLRVSGNSSLRGFEFGFAVLLLVYLTIWDARRRWLFVGVLFVGLGVVLGHGAGPIANLSPNYSAAALSLGTYQLLRKIPSPSSPEQPLRYVVIGLVLAGILALRFYFIVSVVIAVLIVLVTLRGRKCMQSAPHRVWNHRCCRGWMGRCIVALIRHTAVSIDSRQLQHVIAKRGQSVHSWNQRLCPYLRSGPQRIRRRGHHGHLRSYRRLVPAVHKLAAPPNACAVGCQHRLSRSTGHARLRLRGGRHSRHRSVAGTKHVGSGVTGHRCVVATARTNTDAAIERPCVDNPDRIRCRDIRFGSAFARTTPRLHRGRTGASTWSGGLHFWKLDSELGQ